MFASLKERLGFLVALPALIAFVILWQMIFPKGLPFRLDSA
ncbi:MAG: hypothetical protein ACM3NH_01960 [Candidatus Saccharibacteria bacterium]